MTNQDTSTEDETNNDEQVETANTEDESTSETEDTSEEETEDGTGEEDSEDEQSETEDDEEPAIKKRFTQFKGETYEEYTPELEKAYGNVLAEMTRLKEGDKEKTSKLDAVMAAAAKDEDFAKKLNDLLGDDAQEITVDPALLKARQDMNAQMDKEYTEFVDEHPEMESDPVLAQEVLDILSDFGKQARKQNKILGMGEALRKAWAYLGKDDTQEKVAIKAKETAAKSKTGNSAKKPSGGKLQFTEAQVALAKKWGLTPEQLAAANKNNT